MKYKLVTTGLFLLITATTLLASVQAITLEALNGPDGYFKTYDDFLHNTAVPFDKVLCGFAYKNTPFSITFFSNKQKNKLGQGEVWGYRSKNTLYRIIPGNYNVVPVVCIGDMILYGDDWYEAWVFTKENSLYYNAAGRCFVSKDLNSEVLSDPGSLKAEYRGLYNDFFDCSENARYCYVKEFRITYALSIIEKQQKIARYEKIDGKVNNVVVITEERKLR